MLYVPLIYLLQRIFLKIFPEFLFYFPDSQQRVIHTSVCLKCSTWRTFTISTNVKTSHINQTPRLVLLQRILSIIWSKLQDKGFSTYNAQFFKRKRNYNHAKSFSKLKCHYRRIPIGHSLEDIAIKWELEIPVVDNKAFVNHIMNSDTNWDLVFPVKIKVPKKH